MTAPSLIKAIHTLKSRAGLSDDEYRALMAKTCGGKTSSTVLSDREAARLCDALRPFAGANPNRSAASTASGKYAPVLRALWIAGWNLAVVRSRDDRALLAFVERQTKLKHTRFLVEPAAAKRAIEALKSWIARESGVEWPEIGLNADDGLAAKTIVCAQIARRLVAAGGFTAFAADRPAWPADFELYANRCGLPASFDYYTAAQWDELANRLGARLRATLAAQAKRKAA